MHAPSRQVGLSRRSCSESPSSIMALTCMTLHIHACTSMGGMCQAALSKNAMRRRQRPCGFAQDVHWGELDYLVVDAPPGTSDEHISIAQFLKTSHVDGAVIVTTPQDVAIIDVRKEVNFCRKV